MSCLISYEYENFPVLVPFNFSNGMSMKNDLNKCGGVVTCDGSALFPSLNIYMTGDGKYVIIKGDNPLGIIINAP